MKARFAAEGVAGLVHRLRGRPSPHRLAAAIRARAVALLQGGTYAGLNDCHLTEKLREVVRTEPIAGRQVTMSFGVAVSGPGGFDVDTQYGRADDALYEAKRLGRDRVVLSRAA